MAKRKSTPVKPNSKFTCTMYLSGLGVAIKIQGETKSNSHRWYDELLCITFTPLYPAHVANYSGSQSAIIFHESGRVHCLTQLRATHLNSEWHFICDGLNELEFVEPACEWCLFNLERFEEIMQLPKPKMIGFEWYYNRHNHQSKLFANYNRCHTEQFNSNLTATKYVKPNKLDIMLEEISYEQSTQCD